MSSTVRATLLAAALPVAALLAPVPAHAVTATLSAAYFEIVSGTIPGFGSDFPIVAAGSSLGPNGFPVATGGVTTLAPGGEIPWWSPALNANVSLSGTGTISLPYSSNMYAPNSTGSNNASFFETAKFSGAFSLGASSTVTFQLGSDDDSFIFVDGVLMGQNPGIHGVTNVNFTSPTLSAGAHQVDIFYADRQRTGAFLSLNLISDEVVITPPTNTPEPASMALLATGFLGLLATRRRKG